MIDSLWTRSILVQVLIITDLSRSHHQNLWWKIANCTIMKTKPMMKNCQLHHYENKGDYRANKDLCNCIKICIHLIRKIMICWSLNKMADILQMTLETFNGCTTEVWEWISYFIPHFIMDVITYPCWDLNWFIHYWEYPKSSHCNSLEEQARVHFIYGCPILKWVAETIRIVVPATWPLMIGYTSDKHVN